MKPKVRGEQKKTFETTTGHVENETPPAPCSPTWQILENFSMGFWGPLVVHHGVYPLRVVSVDSVVIPKSL